MREPRNPFRLRSAEQIESDLSFLRLFGPGMLDLISSNTHWDRPQILRSAAGGGKTSLLRLLTPSLLLTLHANRGSEDLKELYQRMSELGVVGEDGPLTLGVLLPCNRNYANLEDLEYDPARKERLFFGLLNARIILAALRAGLSLHGLVFPRDLSRLTISGGTDRSIGGEDDGLVSGKVLYEWATRQEDSVCEAIDSFDPWEQEISAGQDTLTALQLLKPQCLLVDGRPVAQRIVLLLDDVHLLTYSQRSTLFRTLAQLRSGVAIWVAERFEALTVDELLSSGASQGRDYDVLLIEQHWRRQKKRFEHLVLNAADRRAQAAIEVEIPSFEPYLVGSLDGAEWQDVMTTILRKVEAQVRDEIASDVKFQDWLQHEDLANGTTRDRATSWRTLEILVHRERRKSQGSFDFTLPSEDFEDRSDSQVRAAAELFLAYEHNLPYYFGSSRLTNLASYNIEQFLWLAGDEFEEIVAAAIVRRPPELSPTRQDSIVRRASEQLWREIPRRARFGERVQYFLDSMARFCQYMTYMPNAPYDPGVTGIAISMEDRSLLLNETHLKERPDYARLAEVLASAIAHNLLEPTLDYKCKGSMWMVLNLNRLLCPRHWLPLQYGGFKEKPLDELYSWVVSGFKPPKKGESLL